MTENLRELAGKIDKATPGPWQYSEHQDRIYTHKAGARCTICRDLYDPDADAICLARNESPDLLRQAADEIEAMRETISVLCEVLEEVGVQVCTSSDLVWMTYPNGEVKAFSYGWLVNYLELQKEAQ